jgi:hypothetical protein
VAIRPKVIFLTRWQLQSRKLWMILCIYVFVGVRVCVCVCVCVHDDREALGRISGCKNKLYLLYLRSYLNVTLL